jgi:hypothetical protein
MMFSLVPSEEGVEPVYFSLYYRGERVGVIYVLEYGVYDAIAHSNGEAVQLNQASPVSLGEARQLLQAWATEHG